jgi:hypothetical protein
MVQFEVTNKVQACVGVFFWIEMNIGGRHDANIYEQLGGSSFLHAWGQMHLYYAPFKNSTHYTLEIRSRKPN